MESITQVIRAGGAVLDDYLCNRPLSPTVSRFLSVRCLSLMINNDVQRNVVGKTNAGAIQSIHQYMQLFYN